MSISIWVKHSYCVTSIILFHKNLRASKVEIRWVVIWTSVKSIFLVSDKCRVKKKVLSYCIDIHWRIKLYVSIIHTSGAYLCILLVYTHTHIVATCIHAWMWIPFTTSHNLISDIFGESLTITLNRCKINDWENPWLSHMLAYCPCLPNWLIH